VAGVFVSSDGLVLTTYRAVRGADAVEAEFPDASPVRSGITVAAWDSKRNLAVIKIAATRTDSLVPNAGITDGQYAWNLGVAPCPTPSVARARIASWDHASGPLQLADSTALALQGGPIVDRTGAFLGLATSTRTAVAAIQAADLIALARKNVAARQTRRRTTSTARSRSGPRLPGRARASRPRRTGSGRSCHARPRCRSRSPDRSAATRSSCW
jgi:hypothetical protein